MIIEFQENIVLPAVEYEICNVNDIEKAFFMKTWNQVLAFRDKNILINFFFFVLFKQCLQLKLFI